MDGRGLTKLCGDTGVDHQEARRQSVHEVLPRPHHLLRIHKHPVTAAEKDPLHEQLAGRGPATPSGMCGRFGFVFVLMRMKLKLS